MTDIHETAYPHLKSDTPTRELEEIFTPSKAVLKFAFSRRQPTARYANLLLLNSFQTLGYFGLLREVPASIKRHIAKAVPSYY